jgi:hypothetical protein
MFADFGATPFAKTVPVINGAKLKFRRAQVSARTRRMT